MNDSAICRSSRAALLVVGLLAAPVGCHSRAHQDLYRQRMAGEIRNLEDQLYEADYQNRVLRDKLSKCKVEIPPSTRSSGQKPPRVAPAPESIDMGHGFDSIDELEVPDFEMGTEIDPGELGDPGVLVEPGTMVEPGSIDATPQRGPLKDPAPPTMIPTPRAEPDESTELLPAPGGPEPPGERDTNFPEVVPGEILPPPVGEEDEVKPPGQIRLPDSAQADAGIPDDLRIHTGLSGGHRIDGTVEGMMIVVNVVDKLGKTVDLNRFDIDAELSVVVLDPTREADEARIGRWDFPNAKVGTLVRSRPISGLHIPIEWNEDGGPDGDEVIVHVRLRGEDDEMRCEGRLKVEKETAVAEWTPRGEALR